MKKANLVAEKRQQKGKNAARQLRREKKIPAVLYGRGSTPVPLAVKYQDFAAALHGQESRNTLLSLRIAGAEEQEILSLPKEIQIDPIEGTVLHVDFQQIHLDEAIHTKVPIRIVGASPGVKAGGVLEHLMRELDIECLPMAIPSCVEADISVLDIGDALHVSDLNVEGDFRVVSDLQRTVVLVAAPTVEKAPEVEAVEEEAAEGEEKEAGEPDKAEAPSEKQD